MEKKLISQTDHFATTTIAPGQLVPGQYITGQDIGIDLVLEEQVAPESDNTPNMAVRRPRSGLSKKKKGGPALAKVRGIKSDSGWTKAMKKSEGCYLVVHMLTETVPSASFKSYFALMSAKKELSKLVFAEATAERITALRPWLERKLPAPAIVVYHKGKIIEEMYGNACGFNGFQQLQALAEKAPSGGGLLGVLKKAVPAVLAVAAVAAGAFVYLHKRSTAPAKVTAPPVQQTRSVDPAYSAAYADVPDLDLDEDWDDDF